MTEAPTETATKPDIAHTQDVAEAFLYLGMCETMVEAQVRADKTPYLDRLIILDRARDKRQMLP